MTGQSRMIVKVADRRWQGIRGPRCSWFWPTLALLLVTPIAFGMSVTMNSSVVAGGGGVSTSGSYRLTGTVGQPVIDVSQDGGLVLYSGLHHPLLADTGPQVIFIDQFESNPEP